MSGNAHLPLHGRQHRPLGALGPSDPGGADPIANVLTGLQSAGSTVAITQPNPVTQPGLFNLEAAGGGGGGGSSPPSCATYVATVTVGAGVSSYG